MHMMSNSKSVITSSFLRTICSLLVCFSLLSCASNNTVLIDEFETPLTEEERAEESFKENRSENGELLNRNDEEDLTLLTPQSPLAAGYNEFSIEQSVEGLLVSRLTIVSVPEVLDPNHTYPVIFGFHGNGGTPQSMIPLLDRFVQDGRIIAVYPEGYMRSWNLGPELSAANELEFMNILMAFLDQYPELKGPKFALGISNGAAFSHYLAANTNYFEGIAAFVSPLIVGNEPKGQATPITVIQVSGVEDNVIPYQGGPSAVGHTFHSARESSAIWAIHNNCEMEILREEIQEKIFFKSYENCDGGTVVHDYAVLDAGHNLSWGLMRQLIESTVTTFQQTLLSDSESDLRK